MASKTGARFPGEDKVKLNYRVRVRNAGSNPPPESRRISFAQAARCDSAELSAIENLEAAARRTAQAVCFFQDRGEYRRKIAG